MRTWWTLLSVAVLLGVVATALIMTAAPADDGYGWFAYAPDRAAGPRPTLHLLSGLELLGWLAAWAGSVIATGAIAYRIGRRPGS